MTSSQQHKTPDTFAGIRLVIGALVLFVVVLAGIGLAGYGPVGGLVTVTDHLRDWISDNTGFDLS